MVGFRDRFNNEDLISKFRGIISSHVKDCISKIMINGKLSYFMMNAHLFDLSGVIKERLDTIFEDYGIKIQYFNIETIEVPEADYQKVSEAKERRSSRMIEGYTLQEERQMMIAEKFAGNEGTMGNVGGADLPENAKFCLNCGEKVQREANTVVCPDCGKTVPVGKFCFECGYKFGKR